MKKFLAAAAAVSAVIVTCLSACSGSAVNFKLSKTDGNSWTNEYLGLTAEFPENWVFDDEETLKSTNNVSEWSDSALYLTLESEGVITDTIATNEKDGAYLALNYENLKVSGSVGMTAEEYVNSVLDTAEESLVTAGFDSAEANAGTVTLAGKECPCIDLVGHYGDDLSVKNKVIVMKIDHYIALFTVSAMDEASLENILSCFKNA